MRTNWVKTLLVQVGAGFLGMAVTGVHAFWSVLQIVGSQQQVASGVGWRFVCISAFLGGVIGTLAYGIHLLGGEYRQLERQNRTLRRSIVQESGTS